MPATGSATNTVRLTRILKAAPPRVFEAWTTPEGMKRWASPGEMTVPSATADLRVGGRYEIRMRAPDGAEHRVAGVYREIVAPGRLVYTWQWQDQPGAPETIVTVEFRAHGTGTELVLLHELPDADAQAKHLHGWTGCLAKLEQMFT
jgi:uncharacterized protein YndB with AHSA1/START domain